LIATCEQPADVRQLADGFYYHVENIPDPVTGGTNTKQTMVCEDCWQPIPRYIDFPKGLVSPESDGDEGVNFIKHRMVAMETNEPKMGMEHLQKAVCLPCYLEAFARVYPGAKLPKLRDECTKTVSPEPVVEVGHAADPTV
jgi:hypothetical protein